MPGNFVELPGIHGRRRGDLNPIHASESVSAFALQINGSRPIGTGLLKPQKPLHRGQFDCASPQWGDNSRVLSRPSTPRLIIVRSGDRASPPLRYGRPLDPLDLGVFLRLGDVGGSPKSSPGVANG